MSVLFDSVASASVETSVGNTLSWTHTPVGIPSAVAILIYNREDVQTITGVTYGGVTLVSSTDSPNLVGFETHLGGLANPPAGAQTVVITFSGTGAICYAGSIAVTGSDINKCFRDYNSHNNLGVTNHTVVLNNDITGDFVVGICGNSGGGILSPNGNEITRWSFTGTGSKLINGASISSTAPTTMSWTTTNFSLSSCSAAAFQAAVTPTLMGAMWC